MEQTQNQSDYQSAFCYFLRQSERQNKCPKLDTPSLEPLDQPEESISLNEGRLTLPLESEEEQEENIFNDDETTDEAPSQGRERDPEEQVVPSSQSSHLNQLSQLSDSYKFIEEDVSTTDIEEDEGIFEDELMSADWTLAKENRHFNSQPP